MSLNAVAQKVATFVVMVVLPLKAQCISIEWYGVGQIKKKQAASQQSHDDSNAASVEAGHSNGACALSEKNEKPESDNISTLKTKIAVKRQHVSSGRYSGPFYTFIYDPRAPVDLITSASHESTHFERPNDASKPDLLTMLTESLINGRRHLCPEHQDNIRRFCFDLFELNRIPAFAHATLMVSSAEWARDAVYVNFYQYHAVPLPPEYLSEGEEEKRKRVDTGYMTYSHYQECTPFPGGVILYPFEPFAGAQLSYRIIVTTFALDATSVQRTVEASIEERPSDDGSYYSTSLTPYQLGQLTGLPVEQVDPDSADRIPSAQTEMAFIFFPLLLSFKSHFK